MSKSALAAFVAALGIILAIVAGSYGLGELTLIGIFLGAFGLLAAYLAHEGSNFLLRVLLIGVNRFSHSLNLPTRIVV